MIDLPFVSSTALHWLTPAAVYSAVTYVFKVVDDNMSTDAKADLRSFIIDAKYQQFMGNLPAVIESTFCRTFGDRQISRKCLTRSIRLTLWAMAAVIITLLLTNFHNLKELYLGIDPTLEKMHAALLSRPETAKAANVIGSVQTHKNLILLVPLIWAGWCIIPDYVSVLKTRIIILVLRTTQASAVSLLLTIAIDFFVGLCTFFVSFVIFQIFIMSFALIDQGLLSASLIVDAFLFWILLAIEFSYLTFTGDIFVHFPYATFFWATMLPSVWLWIYIASALLTRSLVQAKSFLTASTYYLDLQDHPVKALGFVAAVILSVVAVAVNLISAAI